MIVETKLGKVQGLEKDGVLQLRGIRYARAARFEAPQPVEAWDDVLDASAFGPIAPQNPSPLETMLGAGESPSGEDCLFLNVFTPAADDARRPVLVWIHGGGFTAGAGSIPWYSGARLAAGGDVVVVTVNYRLGALGFLHLPDIPGSGNAGLLDQVAALEWVRDNVEQLGGDPSNVTIFGESAGGMSVGTLLGTPAARGLFQQAVAQSGATANVAEADGAHALAERFLHELGIAGGDLDRLRRAPVADLLGAQQSLGAQLLRESTTLRLPFCPVVDGNVLPEHPLAAVRAGAAQGVRLLLGTTKDEFNLFHVMARAAGPMDDEALGRRASFVAGADRAGAAIELYRQGRPGATPDDLFCAMATDVVFRIPAIELAEAQSAQQPDTWMYRFDYRSTAFDGALGACHAIDVPFVFDNLDRRGVDFFLGGIDDGTRAVAHAASRAWLAFARAGDPHHDGLPAWPRYSAEQRSVLAFDRTCTVLDDPDPDERAFWQRLA